MNRSLLIAIMTLCSHALTLSGQNLTGTVNADDTGSPLAGATIVVTRPGALSSQRPQIQKVRTNTSGRFDLDVLPGAYRICVHDAGLYLNPCQWSTRGLTPVLPVAATTVPIFCRDEVEWRGRRRGRSGRCRRQYRAPR